MKTRKGTRPSTPEQHRLEVARRILNTPDEILAVMGWPTKKEAAETIRHARAASRR